MKTRENFCKSCFWFKSNQILFAKLFKQKSEKKKEKSFRKEEKAAVITSAQVQKMAYGPIPSPPRTVISFPPQSLTGRPHLSSLPGSLR
jgi:hypothetical protein